MEARPWAEMGLFAQGSKVWRPVVELKNPIAADRNFGAGVFDWGLIIWFNIVAVNSRCNVNSQTRS